tara:strand:- start:642 stop:1217 length:576 start_codon:yes stop_codon:yes gene_type:complete
MDYFMHYLKKNSNKLVVIICIVLFSINAYSMEQEIEINDIKLDFEAGHYLLSYSQSISLLSEAREALSKGIPFYFLVTAKIYQKNKYGFSNLIQSKEFYFQLKYKSLLKKYMVSDMNDQKSYFNNIDDALKKLSYIKKWNIGPSIYLKEGTLELKAKLDKKYLPKALQINFNEKSWDVESEIKRYQIGQLN